MLSLLRKLLGSKPPSSYSFAASEVYRRHDLPLDRATVRRWALANHLAPDTRSSRCAAGRSSKSASCQRPPALPFGQRLRPLAISLRSILAI